MRLRSILERNLLRIYEAENQSLHITEFLITGDGVHSIPQRIVSELVDFDLIETEDDKNVFYLTTAGYNYVEQIILGKGSKKNQSTDIFEMKDIEEYLSQFGRKKMHLYIVLWLGLLALLATLYIANL